LTGHLRGIALQGALQTLLGKIKDGTFHIETALGAGTEMWHAPGLRKLLGLERLRVFAMLRTMGQTISATHRCDGAVLRGEITLVSEHRVQCGGLGHATHIVVPPKKAA
jgi:hypothetical protein